jgi:hypothetical protein
LPSGNGAVTVALVSGWQLFELLRLQVEDFWRLQLSSFGFIGNWMTEAYLLKKPVRRPPPELITDLFYFLFMPSLRIIGRVLSVGVLVLLAATFGDSGTTSTPRWYMASVRWRGSRTG